MKRIIVAAAMLSLIFSVGILWAQMGKPMMGGPEKMMMGLNLSEEQQAKLADMRLQMQKEMIPLRSDLQSLRSKLKLEIVKDNPDQKVIDNLLTQISDKRKQIMKMRIQHQQELRKLLSPEQRKKFDAMILSGRRFGGHKGMMHRQRMHDRPGPGAQFRR